MGRKAFSSRDFQFASSSANGRPSGLNFRRSRGLILLRPAHDSGAGNRPVGSIVGNIGYNRRLIPTRTERHALAQSRRPMGMTRYSLRSENPGMSQPSRGLV